MSRKNVLVKINKKFMKPSMSLRAYAPEFKQKARNYTYFNYVRDSSNS